MIGEYLTHCLEQLEYNLCDDYQEQESIGDFASNFEEMKNHSESKAEDFSIQDSYLKILEEGNKPQPKRKSGEKLLFDVFGVEDYDVIGGIMNKHDKYNRR